jgi:folate-binding Fe-S cluster repair protein YgfZ
MLAAISYTKGCYVGQETIARLKSVGHVNRSLVFLRSDSAAFPVSGTKLKQGDHETGIVTSSGYSPRLERGIALGYAQRQAATEGVSLQADGLNLTVAASLRVSAK